MHPHAPSLAPGRARPLASAGFTLVELMLAAAIGAVVCAAGLAALVNLQKSYTATEQYATSLTDQMRLVDYLTMDLRRSKTVNFDADGNGVMLELPDYYYFNASDTKRTYPLPNTPTVPDDHSRALYGNATTPPRVYYHFDRLTGIMTREEVLAGQPVTNTAPAQQPVAGNIAGFPSIVLDNFIRPLSARVTVSFQPMFQTPGMPDNNMITLHSVTFLRNNDTFR
jgi:prepilin-type N-terminal cleavage/methylation domain-containing protein